MVIQSRDRFERGIALPLPAVIAFWKPLREPVLVLLVVVLLPVVLPWPSAVLAVAQVFLLEVA